jgi:hypothetical protein
MSNVELNKTTAIVEAAKIQKQIDPIQSGIDGMKDEIKTANEKVQELVRQRTAFWIASTNGKTGKNPELRKIFEAQTSKGTANWSSAFHGNFIKNNEDIGFNLETPKQVKATAKNILNRMDELEIYTVADMKAYGKEEYNLSELGQLICEQSSKMFCGSKGNLHPDHEEKLMEGLIDLVVKFEKKDK